MQPTDRQRMTHIERMWFGRNNGRGYVLSAAIFNSRISDAMYQLVGNFLRASGKHDGDMEPAANEIQISSQIVA